MKHHPASWRVLLFSIIASGISGCSRQTQAPSLGSTNSEVNPAALQAVLQTQSAGPAGSAAPLLQGPITPPVQTIPVSGTAPVTSPAPIIPANPVLAAGFYTGAYACGTPNPTVIIGIGSSDPDISVDYDGVMSGASGEGVLVGPPIPLPQGEALDPVGVACSPYLGGNEYPGWAAVGEKTIGANFVTSISYVGTDCNCYQADTTGTYQITCRAGLPPLPGNSNPPKLSSLPSILNGSYPWIGADGRCFHTQGDDSCDLYGGPEQAICGGSSAGLPGYYTGGYTPIAPPTSPAPVAAQPPSQGYTPIKLPVDSPTAPAPTSGPGYYNGTYACGTPNPAAVSNAGTSDPDISADYDGVMSAPSGEGTLVGPPIPLPRGEALDPVGVACSPYLGGNEYPGWAAVGEKTIGMNFVTSISYVGTDCNCYQADTTGTYRITCRAGLPPLPGNLNPPPLASLPNILDSSYPWLGADGRCFHTQGDDSCDMYGGPEEAICGGTPADAYGGYNAEQPAPTNTSGRTARAGGNLL